MARATYHHHDLAAALLTAADQLVAEKGVAGFSLREAARVVGVDPAACYRHFRDKEAVVQALARRGFTRLQLAFEAALARPKRAPAKKRLLELGRAYVSFASDHSATFRLMFGPTGVDARDSTLRGDYPEERGPYSILETTVQDWLQESQLDPSHAHVSVLLWAGMHGMACLLTDGALRPADPAERAALIDMMFETLVRGIATEPKNQPPRPARAKRGKVKSQS